MHAIEPSAAPQPPPPVLFSQDSTHSFSPITLRSSLHTILAVKNYYILARLLLWVVSRTTLPGYVNIAVGVIRACDEAFIAMEMLPELLDTLAKAGKLQDQQPLPAINSLNAMLADILAKYRETSACKKWTEENPGHLSQSRTVQQSQPLLPNAVAQIRDVLSRSGPIPEDIEQIIKSYHSLEKAVGACIHLLAEDGRPIVRHAVLLLSLVDPSSTKLGGALKSALSACILFYNNIFYFFLLAILLL